MNSKSIDNSLNKNEGIFALVPLIDHDDPRFYHNGTTMIARDMTHKGKYEIVTRKSTDDTEDFSRDAGYVVMVIDQLSEIPNDIFASKYVPALSKAKRYHHGMLRLLNEGACV